MPEDAFEPIRLQKYLARSGCGGRRRCEEFILEGRVCVNGVVVTELGTKVDPHSDEVMLDGCPVLMQDELVVLALNKPAGIYSTMREQAGRECVADLLPMRQYPSLYHIGRLDRDTTGILLFTNDGTLGNELLHPSRHVDKEYLAQVKGWPSERGLAMLRAGIEIRRGERYHHCAPAEVEVLDRLPKRFSQQQSCLEPGIPGTSLVRICIHEGVKHQVKLMLGEIGNPVLRLHRASFGPISCGTLPLGSWRMLDANEINALR